MQYTADVDLDPKSRALIDNLGLQEYEKAVEMLVDSGYNGEKLGSLMEHLGFIAGRLDPEEAKRILGVLIDSIPVLAENLDLITKLAAEPLPLPS